MQYNYNKINKKDFKKITVNPKWIEYGDLFVDYNNSIEDVNLSLSKGARGIVTEMKLYDIPDDIIYIQIPDVKKNLSSLLSQLYDDPSKKLKIVGVTGTNGKTSVTNFLFHVLTSLKQSSCLFSTTIAKHNDVVLDIPLYSVATLHIQRLLAQIVEKKCTYCCMELTSISINTEHLNAVHFAGAIFTNLTHDHLDIHGSMENYFRVKKKLFDNLSKDSFALINADDKYSTLIIADCKAKKYTFSLQNSQANFYAKVIKESLVEIILEIEGREWSFPLKGTFNAYNLLAAYGAAVLLGQNKNEVLQSLQSAQAPTGRLQPIENNKGIHAFVDFAHTPDGLEKVLATVSNMKKDDAKVIVVVGCGGNKDKEKRPVMGKVAVQNSDMAIFTSDNPRSEDPLEIIKAMMYDLPEEEKGSLSIETDREIAIEKACQMAKPGDIILVAGKGHEETQEINGERQPFSDQEVLQTALNRPNVV